MKTALPTILMLLAVAAAPAANAQPESAYYGLSIGELDYTDSNFGNELFADTASTWHLMVGYQFLEHLAVEGAYGKSSKIRDARTFQGPTPGTQDDVVFVSELERILTIRLLGVLGFDNGISLMAGIGYADIKQDIELNVNGVPVVGGDITGNNPAYYFGAQYNWDRIALRLAYEKYDIDRADASETSLTFFYKL